MSNETIDPQLYTIAMNLTLDFGKELITAIEDGLSVQSAAGTNRRRIMDDNIAELSEKLTKFCRTDLKKELISSYVSELKQASMVLCEDDYKALYEKTLRRAEKAESELAELRKQVSNDD